MKYPKKKLTYFMDLIKIKIKEGKIMDTKEKKPKKTKISVKKKKKSSKGALIKGMTKRLPSEILDNSIFKSRLREVMKGYSGIYALYRKDELYYVGLAKDLLGRINWHLKDRHAGKWESFVIFRIKRIDYLKDIETLITHLIEIPGNKIKGQLPRDADINRILQDILTREKKEIGKIERALRFR